MAYYDNIERNVLLKEKPVDKHVSYSDKGDTMQLPHSPMSKEKEQEPEEVLAEVTHPLFLLAREDVHARVDGEVEDTPFGLNGKP